MTPRDRYFILGMFKIIMLALFVLLRHTMELTTYGEIRTQYDKLIDETKGWE